jgi:hypothetical protein
MLTEKLTAGSVGVRKGCIQEMRSTCRKPAAGPPNTSRGVRRSRGRYGPWWISRAAPPVPTALRRRDLAFLRNRRNGIGHQFPVKREGTQDKITAGHMLVGRTEPSRRHLIL